MEARSRPVGSGSSGAQRFSVCGSVCSFVSWTGTGSIADINEMEATSGDRGGMETGSFVLGFCVALSSFVFSFVVWQVASSSSSSTRHVVRNHGGQRAAVLVGKPCFFRTGQHKRGKVASKRRNVIGHVASLWRSVGHTWVLNQTEALKRQNSTVKHEKAKAKGNECPKAQIDRK